MECYPRAESRWGAGALASWSTPCRHRWRSVCAKRRTLEGVSKMEIIRCVKRHLAREAYRTLRADLEDLHGAW